jgi:GAF domain-containing protein
LSEVATWHEALTDAVARTLPLDLLACWLLPSRGGSVLLGPPGLHAPDLEVPPAEPIIVQEALFQLEDRLAAAGYRSVIAVPIRSEVQDVGVLVTGRFEPDGYTLADQRALHRIAAMLAHPLRRLAAQSWVTPATPSDDRATQVAGMTEAILDALDLARHGGDLVQLASDAIGALLPHDRCELVAVAPAPDCWALVGSEGVPGRPLQLTAMDQDRIDALVHHLGSRDTARLGDLRRHHFEWPGTHDRREADRQRSLLAARLEVGGEMVGWLWLGHDAPDWFREGDEALLRMVARLLASRVATWTARHELAGAWG